MSEIREAVKKFDIQQCWSMIEDFNVYDAARLIVIGAEFSNHQPSLDIIREHIEWAQEATDDD